MSGLGTKSVYKQKLVEALEQLAKSMKQDDMNLLMENTPSLVEY